MSVKRNTRRFTPPAAQTDADRLSVEETDTPVEAKEVKRVLTVNGMPIPEGFEHAITYAMTDQGLAEARARDERDGSKRRVEVVSDAWDKSVDRFGDAQPWDDFNPLTEAVRKVEEPGFAYRALSQRACDKRSLRGWEPVVDGKGNQVKVGNLFLGRMPVEVKQRRNEHYRRIGEEALQETAEQYALDQERLVKDAKVGGLAPLRVGDHVHDHEDPSLAATIGVETRRGQSGVTA